jgi:hypothetical protein
MLNLRLFEGVANLAGGHVMFQRKEQAIRERLPKPRFPCPKADHVPVKLFIAGKDFMPVYR